MKKLGFLKRHFKKKMAVWCWVLLSFSNIPSQAQWTLTSFNNNAGFKVEDLDFPSDSIGFIVGRNYPCSLTDSCGIIKTTSDGGLSWTTQSLPDDITLNIRRRLYSVSFVNNDTGIVVGEADTSVYSTGFGKIFKTTNGGNTWYEIPFPSGIPEVFYSVQMINSNVGYIAGGKGTILKTIDGGETWMLVPTGITNYLTDVFFLSSDTGFIGGGNIVLKTTDGGSTWLYNTFRGLSIQKLQFINSNIGYAVNGNVYTEDVEILKTTDGGFNWNVIPNNFRVNLNGLYMFNENEGFATGDYGLIIRTTNGFNTWDFEGYHTDENLGSIKFTDSSKGFILGQNSILRTINGGDGITQLVTSIMPQDSFVACNPINFLHTRVYGGSGPYVFQWNPNDYMDDPNNLNPTLLNIDISDTLFYSLTVSDNSGQISADSSLIIKKVFNVHFVITNASCDSCLDGSIYATQLDQLDTSDWYVWHDDFDFTNILSSDSFLINIARGFYYFGIYHTWCEYPYKLIVGPYKTVHGHIYQSNNSALVNSRVHLIKYSTTDSSLTELESTFTDSTGYFAFNTFDSVVYVKVVPDISDYPNEMPTYYDSSLVFQNSDPIYLVTDSTEINFKTIYGTNPGGPGFIGGLISEGAGKMPGAGIPVPDLDLILIDMGGTPVAYTSTNTDGIFTFTNLDERIYAVWVDRPFINNNLAPTIEIASSEPVLGNLQFKLLSDRLVLEESTSVLSLTGENTNFRVFPNPTNDMINIVIQQIKTTPLKIELISLLGSSVTVSESSISAGKHNFHFDLKDFKPGLYFISVRTGSEHFVMKVIKSF